MPSPDMLASMLVPSSSARAPAWSPVDEPPPRKDASPRRVKPGGAVSWRLFEVDDEGGWARGPTRDTSRCQAIDPGR